MKTLIYYKISKSDKTQKVVFDRQVKDSEVFDYFENACGGVYRWSRNEF